MKGNATGQILGVTSEFKWVIVSSELVRLWKEALGAKFKALLPEFEWLIVNSELENAGL